MSADVYEVYCEAANFAAALLALKTVFARTPNETFAPHALSTRKQQPDESLDEYLQVLKSMSKDCTFREVTGVQNREDGIRNTFIRGLLNSNIRQR